MSASAENVGEQPGPSYQEQKALLDDLQFANATELLTSGVAAKAWALLPNLQRVNAHEASFMRVAVARRSSRVGRATSQGLQVSFLCKDKTPNGQEQSWRSYVAVAENYDEGRVTQNTFTEEEADTLERMAAQLEECKERGLLPDLTADCTDIADHSSGLTQSVTGQQGYTDFLG